LLIEPIDPLDPAARTALGRYFGELDHRFDGGFDAGDAVTADAPAYRSPTGCFLVAWDDADAVACGAVMAFDATTAEIKRMWVDERFRGLGVGAAMLAELERTAALLRYQRVVLDTNGALTEALALYGRSGYATAERYNDNPYAQHWFAKELPPTIEPLDHRHAAGN
jgi:GNAT superfamily N-acetyltransferase